MNNNSAYIRAIGDADYNFAYNDFTIEFFASTTVSDGCQTLFEITNNESNAANLYTKTRFLSTIEYGNLNAYAIQINTPFFVPGNTSVFTSPTTISSSDKVFYNGEFLTNDQYTITTPNIITISNVSLNPVNTFVEVGPVLFEITGSPISSNTIHFISTERYQGKFYLFLDGISQSVPVDAYTAIPTQILTNTISNGNISRINSPALLTIGANRDGKNPFFGQFGDIKIINGTAQHVSEIKMKDSIVSSFTDYNLGTQNSAIVIGGGNFVDSITSYSPEEYINGQLFDTLCLKVYQNNIANANVNVLSYLLFKPTILIGPVGSYQYTMPSNNATVISPWFSMDSAAASVVVNGNAIASDEWYIDRGLLTVNATANSNIEIIATGQTNYFDMSNSFSTTLTTNLYSTDTTINVANANVFMVPILSNTYSNCNAVINRRGQIIIDDECITYLYVNTANNTLFGLMRGTSGTAVSNVHISGTPILSASYNNDLQYLTGIDPRIASWYTYPLANTSLQNTNSIISTVLTTFGGLTPP